MKRAVFSLIFFLLASGSALGYERIVVLYAPASSIIKALGAGDRVVGRTRTDRTFPEAVNVGSHLRPNIELIKALRPDLIIAGSRRAFPDEMAERFEATLFRYDPRTLEDIFNDVLVIGRLLGRQVRAEAIVKGLRDKLSHLVPLSYTPTVVYEVSAHPLKVAGQRSIVTEIINLAGGRNLINVKRKHVLLSPEQVLALRPDVYIYQEGPMNRSPEMPLSRAYFKGLKVKVLKVKELEFARPGLNVVEAILKLNRWFKSLEDGR